MKKINSTAIKNVFSRGTLLSLCLSAFFSIGCETEIEEENILEDDSIALEEVADEDIPPATDIDQNISGNGITEKGCRIDRNDYDRSITVSEGYWGTWASCTEFCPANSFAYSMRLKVEGPNGDNTGLNGVILKCYNKSNGRYQGYVNSRYSRWGSWYRTVTTLPYTVSNPIVGGNIKLKNPGGDDMGATNLMLTSKNGNSLFHPVPLPYGNFQGFRSCPAKTAVCGIRTRIERPQGPGRDDTALNGVQLACCDF